MAVDPNNIDLNGIEDVSDIEPAPTIAVSRSRMEFGSVGEEGKRLLKELMDKTEDEPMSRRVFTRLGVGYSHAQWGDYDLYWADDEDEFVEALENWNSANNL